MEHFVVHGNYACFYGGCFSQWYRCTIIDKGIKFNCSEQDFMYNKAKIFSDEKIAEEILKANHPKEQKVLGRKISSFNADVWNKVAKKICYDINILKFKQNRDLLRVLLSTKGLTIVEASPIDTIWGIGRGLDFPHLDDKSQWRGTNWLGQVLTKVRNDLR